jgi:hypothetical protein
MWPKKENAKKKSRSEPHKLTTGENMPPSWACKKKKNEIRPITGHEGPEGE